MKLQIQKWFRNFCDENFVLSQCFFGGKTPNLLERILNNFVGFNTSSFRVVNFAERVRMRASMILIVSLLGELISS